MILTSRARYSLELPVAYGRGADTWWLQYAVPLANTPPGTELHAFGKIQGKNYNPFAVEFRCGLFLTDGLVNPDTGNSKCLHPLTGENLGPDVADKYVTLMDAWSLPMPDGLTNPFLSLKVSVRSTQAKAATRVQFGNGYLQVCVV